jgi:integrase
MRAHLTKRVVEAIKPDARGVVQVRDSELKGFAVRVTPNGIRSYSVVYKDAAGRTRRVAIGRHGVFTAEQAREKARVLLGKVSDGKNPSQEKRQRRDEEHKAETVAQFAERYLLQHAERHKKASSVYQDTRLLESIVVPTLGKVRVKDVTRADVTRLHQKLADTPVHANRVLALLSKMFELAERWDVRPAASNPCRHVQRYKEKSRERFLSTAELARLAEVLHAVEFENIEHPSVVPAIRLLILTGARRGEVLGLRCDDINWDGQRLDLSDSKTGKKSIPLNAAALEVLHKLAEARDASNPYVLPGRVPGKPLVGLPHAWGRIRKRAELDGLRLHDLRHSYASVGASAGLSLPLIGALLGHRVAQTTARYAHLTTDARHEAAERIGQRIVAAMRAKPGEVIELPAHPKGRVKGRKAAGG